VVVKVNRKHAGCGHNIPRYLGPELCWNAQGHEKIAREKIGIEVSERRFEMQLCSRHAAVRFGSFNIDSGNSFDCFLRIKSLHRVSVGTHIKFFSRRA
jgi:hypothetical protein